MTTAGNLRGVVWMVLSTIVLSVAHSIVRYLSPEIHSFQTVFFRSFFAMWVILPWVVKYGYRYLATKRFPLHFLRSCLAVTAQTSFYFALTVIPLAKATAIGFLAPILTSVLVIFFLKESTRRLHWWAMLMGVVGMLVILRPGFVALDLGTGLMIFSTVVLAFNLFLIKVLSETESSVVITGYTTVLLVPLSLPLALQVWIWPTFEQWLLLSVMGILTGVGVLLFTQALKEALTTIAMPLDFLRLVWMSVFGLVFFAERLDIYVILGGGVVFVGALIIYTSTADTESKNLPPEYRPGGDRGSRLPK